MADFFISLETRGLEDGTQGNADVLRVPSRLVVEEILQRNAIIHSYGDEGEAPVEAGGEKGPMVLDVLLAVSDRVFGNLQQRLVDDAHHRHE